MHCIVMSNAYITTSNSGEPHYVHLYAIDCKQCLRWANFTETIMLVVTTTVPFSGDMDVLDHYDISKDVARELVGKKRPRNMICQHHPFQRQICQPVWNINLIMVQCIG